MTTLRATEILREFRQGSSVPVLALASDGKQYIVKWSAGHEASAGILTDFLVNRILRPACSFLPDVRFIEIDADVVVHPVHEEVRDLVVFNRGFNLALDYIEGAVEWKYEDGWHGSDAQRALLFLVDLLFLNIDRTQENPNILLRNGEYYPIDFSCSMSVRGLVEGTAYHRSAMLPALKRHPLYFDGCTTSEFAALVAAVRRDDIVRAFAAIPQELAVRAGLEITEATIDNLYAQLQGAAPVLAADMERLRALPAYSAAERKARERSNRAAFEAKFMGKG